MPRIDIPKEIYAHIKPLERFSDGSASEMELTRYMAEREDAENRFLEARWAGLISEGKIPEGTPVSYSLVDSRSYDEGERKKSGAKPKYDWAALDTVGHEIEFSGYGAYKLAEASARRYGRLNGLVIKCQWRVEDGKGYIWRVG